MIEDIRTYSIFSLPRQNRLALFFIIAVSLIVFLFSLQGIDFTDGGYWATNYALFFKDPKSVSSGMGGLYFSMFIGAAWYKITSWLGFFSFRLAYFLVILITAYISQKIISELFEIPRQILLFALGITMLYCTYDPYGEMAWISYNDLSALFYLISLYFIHRSLQSDSIRHQYFYLYFSGLTLGLNIFVRLPNMVCIALITMILGIFLVFGTRRISFREFVIFLAGLFSGVVTVIVIIQSLGHWELFRESVALLFRAGEKKQSIYSSQSLISGFVGDFYESGLVVIAILPVILAFGFIASFAQRMFSGIYAFFASVLLGFFGFYYLDPYVRHLVSIPRPWTLTALPLFFVVLWMFLNRAILKKNNGQVLILLLSIITLTLGGFGSGRALFNYRFYIWIPLLFSLCILLKAQEFRLRKIYLSKSGLYIIKVFCSTVLISYCLIGKYQTVYRDSQNRTTLLRQINSQKMLGVFTSFERLQTIESLISQLSKYTRPGDTILAFECIPMVHFLTETIPYLSNPNPMYYTPEVFHETLEKVRNEKPSFFPVIVSSKMEMSYNWPTEIKSIHHPNPHFESSYQSMRSDVENLKLAGKYSLVWEDPVFEIWAPGK